MTTLPTTKVEISFASAWDAVSPTWVDVTSYVRSIDISRGRQADLNPFDNGTARIELDNRDGRFNPSNTASPYYPNVKPRRQIKITATYTTTTRTNMLINPSFETDTTGWVSANASMSRVAGNFTRDSGLWLMKSTATSTAIYGPYVKGATYLPVTVGVTYTASAYVLRTVGSRSYVASIKFINSGGSIISTFTGTSSTCSTITRLTVSGAAPATAVRAELYLQSVGTGSIGDAHQIDNVLFEASSSVGSYFDGDSSGITTWSGTPYASTSIEQTTTWPLFQGYVQTWPQEYPQYGLDATSTITAVDGLAILGGMKTPVDEMAARISAGELPALFARWKLGDTDTTYPRYMDSSGNGRDLPAVMGQYTGPALAKYLDDASSVFAYGNGSQGYAIDTFHTSFSVSMWIQTTGVGSGSFIQPFFYAGRAGLNPTRIGVASDGTVYCASFDYNPGFTPSVSSSVKVNDGQPHHICYVSGGGSNKVYVDGVDRSVASGSVGFTGQLFGSFALALPIPNATDLQYYGYMQDVCVWTSSLTATQVGYVYGIGTGLSSGELTSVRANRLINAIWSNAPKSIATGSGYCSTSEYNENALNALQKVADTEGSLFFVDRSGNLTLRNRYYWSQVAEGMTSQATFADDYGINYENMGFKFDADQMANTFVINSGIGVTQTASDSATVTEYGPRTLTIDTLLSTVDALSMAQGLAAQYATPVLRSEPFTLNLLSDIDATRVLNLELGYKFTLRRNANGVSSTIIQNLSLDSINHFIRPGTWSVILDGSPRQQYSWFVLDSSLLDSTDDIGY
ncbi:Concanavalin A-like lectin/glucanases superfamily [uncultured Caudovirales phage]|uniref:Concanavalin A-like lectin/glucanases superfamily n=1 Tax=uncultured Caudovirales phage TaxID=2100421 RepID=A0A6J7WLR3_9CAUD|nr:Concanavalin A-like lectin/glucanases superfamily [uncultured Caudovirales phage]